LVFKQKQAEKPFYRRHGYLLSIRSALSQSVKDDGAIERMAKANLERLGSL
jgi:hypothetical protein